MSRVKEQINFNTVLLLVIGALVTFLVKRADEINTSFIKLGVRMDLVEHRIDTLEQTLH